MLLVLATCGGVLFSKYLLLLPFRSVIAVVVLDYFSCPKS